ncbi:uncharacterized protein LOC111866374 isoform X2 [Cryptotermes secundus]|nr:uncharacterized protein LOC111866374 isoform X2 [Cryptotermes secundus]XP_033608119.1 uncharacterized protein LOC111866374 isoform X2 [Cryptotermes secundus]
MPQLPPILSPTTHREVPTSRTTFVMDTSWSRFLSCKSPMTSRSKQNNVGDSSLRSLISPSLADVFLKLPPPAFYANYSSASGTVTPSITAYIPPGTPLHFPPWGSPLLTPMLPPLQACSMNTIVAPEEAGQQIHSSARTTDTEIQVLNQN